MGFSYNVNVLNQKGSPALYTDIFANRPAAGYQGRLFVSTDTAAIYEDTGTAWTLIANVSSGAGTLQQVTTNGNTSNVGISITAGGLSTNSLTDTALTLGSVAFAGTGGLISQDNANLFWDDTNNRLGINTNTPGNSLDVHTSGTTPILALNNTAGSQSAISFLNTSVAKWRIGNTSTNTFDIYNFSNSLTAISISGANNSAAFNANILIAQSSTINQLTGYNAISGDSTGIYFFLGTSANRAYFVLSGLTAARNYTLPNATGTLALTSDLSGYLPLSGGTLTGLLNGTYAIFSGNSSTFGTSSNGGIPLTIQANAVARVLQFLNTLGGTAQILTTGTATTSNIGFNTYSIADAFVIYDNGSAKLQGDLGLWGSATRNLNFYDITNNNINAQIQYSEVNSNTGQLLFKTNNAGTSATRLTISNTGSATFTGAINGTSASLTSYLTGSGSNPGGLGGSRYVLDWLSGSFRLFSYGADASTNGGFILNSQRSDGSNSINFLLIDSTGAATLSSSLGTTALNMNNMSALGSVSGGSIFMPSTAAIAFRSANGSIGYGTIKANTSGQLLLNSSNEGALVVGTGTLIDFNGTTCRFYGNGSTNTFGLGANNAMYYQGDASQFYPTVDNTRNLGTAGFRYTTVYATTALINTSDINEKEQIEELSQLEKNVAIKLKGLIKKFKFKDAVNLKGDKARIHIGVIAQEVKQAFDEEGLNADEYGMFCSDTWYELDGTIVDKDIEGAIEKTRLGIRYEELIIFIISQI